MGSWAPPDSNLGADRIQDYARAGGDFEQLKDELMEILRQSLRPEFINRIDEIIVFRALTDGPGDKLVVGVSETDLDFEIPVASSQPALGAIDRGRGLGLLSSHDVSVTPWHPVGPFGSIPCTIR